MAKFNSTSDKLFKIWKNNEDNIYNFVLHKDIENSLKNTIKKTNEIYNYSSAVYFIDDEFQNLETVWYSSDLGGTVQAWRNWRIVFEKLCIHSYSTFIFILSESTLGRQPKTTNLISSLGNVLKYSNEGSIGIQYPS